MTNDNKNTLRLTMRLLDQAKAKLRLYYFKEAEENIVAAYAELQRLADKEKMNVIE
jgi:hypothetical protein